MKATAASTGEADDLEARPHARTTVGGLLELVAYRQALVELVKRDLKARYKRSALGLLWTMLNPLLMMAVTTAVFSTIFRFAIDHYAVYILSAYVLWGFFSYGTTTAATSVLGSAELIRRIYVPPALFPIAAVAAAAVNLGLSLAPLFAVVVLTGGRVSWALVSLPLALALAVVFTCGVALFLSATSVFFHDAIHIYQALLLAWMYLTPIFYPLDIVPQPWASVVWLNPLFHLVQIFRDPIYAGAWPAPLNVGIAAAYALVAAVTGWWYADRSRDRFAGYL